MKITISFTIETDRESDKPPASAGQAKSKAVAKKRSNGKVPARAKWERIRQIVKERDLAVCRYCGEHAPKGQVDHIFPSSRGGTNDLSNLLWACRRCNASKGNKLLNEWSGRPGAPEQALLEHAIEIVRQRGEASTTMLQRLMRIGWGRASHIIEVMEERGIIGPIVEIRVPRKVIGFEEVPPPTP